MRETVETRSKFSSWPVATFVAGVFFLVWITALLRLHKHFAGEFFWHRNGVVDSLIAVVAPLAIGIRLWQTKTSRKVRKA